MRLGPESPRFLKARFADDSLIPNFCDTSAAAALSESPAAILSPTHLAIRARSFVADHSVKEML
jgi:hypothetical protein